MRRLPQGLGFEPAGSIILEGSGIFQKWGVVGGSGHWQSGALRGIPAAKLPPCDLLPAHEVGPPPPPHRRHHGQNLEALLPLSDCWVFCHSDKNEEYPTPRPCHKSGLTRGGGGWHTLRYMASTSGSVFSWAPTQQQTETHLGRLSR